MYKALSLRPIVVAIPARDEADRIAACLEALNGQIGLHADHIVLLLNNCNDATAEIARAAERHPATMLHVIEHHLPAAQANAGHARRLAMEEATRLAGPDGVLLTTDADGRVDPDWLSANLTAMRDGTDVVAGWVDLDPIDWLRIPRALHEDDARECAYDALCDEIHARIDPDPADPMPRHTQHSGASIAVTASAYARSGGIPDIACGEDRAFLAALRRIDCRIRHAPEVHVTVSGRIEGRSAGGMADTIRRRLSQPDTVLDDRLEPALDCLRRAWCRAELRRLFGDPTRDRKALADRLILPLGLLTGALQEHHFGMAWHIVEEASPALRRHLVPVADLARQSEIAQSILRPLRRRDGFAADQDDPADRRTLELGETA